MTSKDLAHKLVQIVYKDLNDMLSTRADWMLLTTGERMAQASTWREKFQRVIEGKPPSEKYKAFFDGGAKPNPGERKIGGYITKSNDEILSRYSLEIGYGTNNEAEYSSIIFILEMLIREKVKTVSIYGDSLLVVNQVNGLWKANEKMKPYRDQVRDLLIWFDWYELKQIPRGQNTIADSLT